MKFVVYLDNPVDKPNLTDVYLNVYDMVENDFLNNLAQAFSISGIENIGTDFFKSLGQDFLTIGQDIIDSQCEGVQDELFSKRETDDKLDETITNANILSGSKLRSKFSPWPAHGTLRQ